MLKDFLKRNIESKAKYVEFGFAQVEPNHLSAQRNGKIYAQLPADPAIDVLEQGQFVKYDYASGLVNFTGAGEWMLVYNEIKLYREHQSDCEFALIKGDYQARVYSPLDGVKAAELYGPTRFYQGKRESYNNKTGAYDELADVVDGTDYAVASTTHDYWELDNINSDPTARLFMRLRKYGEAMMPANTTMLPRVFKTDIGDHYTTNCINETEVEVNDLLYVGENGILTKTKAEASDTFAGSGDMVWQVVKVYTVPDGQKGAKVLRIA